MFLRLVHRPFQCDRGKDALVVGETRTQGISDRADLRNDPDKRDGEQNEQNKYKELSVLKVTGVERGRRRGLPMC